MKIRNIPYGYRYVNGSIELHPQESIIVSEICQDYLAGKSLLKIAQSLNKRAIEYMEGVIGWNKARIKRIIEDERYLGKGNYPKIIEETLHMQMQTIKSGKNTQKGVDRQADIYQIGVPVRCPVCNQKMHRRCDNVYTHKERWTCTNVACKTMIVKSDEELIKELTDLLNIVIANPELISIPMEKEERPSEELQSFNNEIIRQFNSVNIDKKTLRQKMFEWVSMKYREINPALCVAQKLKDVFMNNKPIESFSTELFSKTVTDIILHKNQTISIILVNKQEIKKGETV